MKKYIKNIKIRDYIFIVIGAGIFAVGTYLGNSIYNSSFEQYLFAIIKSVGTQSAFVVKYVATIIYAILGFLLLCFLFIFPTIDIKKKISFKVKSKGKIVEKQIYPIKNIKVYNIIIFILSIMYIGSVVGFFDFFNNRFRNTDLFKDYYVDARNVEIAFPDEKKNLIYIILESTEMSNVSTDNGGLFTEAITPNLERLAIENINFSNTNLLGGAMPSYGTGWTAASMIAQTSGVPLKVKMDDLNSDSTSFSNIISLGDILSDNGYNNYLLMGSDASFGGRRAYFDNHKYNISDYYTAIEEGKIDEDYHVWWGYEDNKLFTYAKEKLASISKEDKPFNLTILTADTHFTDGYLDESCDSLFDKDYANSFYCSDYMVGKFIKWVQKQDFYNDTVIVITGDHLTMQDKFYKVPKDYDRTIYNAFINTDTEYNKNKNRVFTVMDMYPTTLGALGVNIKGNRLGLGTNLFSNKKTLAEEMGIDVLNSELKKNSKYYYEYIRGNNND